MKHDPALRAAAQAVYESCYPSEEWAPVPFKEAERFGTVHYRQAVEAALRVRANLTAESNRQMVLLKLGLEPAARRRTRTLIASPPCYVFMLRFAT